MNPVRRLSLFAVALVITTTTACAPLNRANARVRAIEDTLAISRAAKARLDSVFMPLGFSAPDSFLVAFETTRGRFDVMVHRRWAPVGTERFYELVHRRFYDSVVVFRVVKRFVAQFGINGAPAVSAAWAPRRIADDPTRESNRRGRISFASAGPHTRTTQVFINFADNPRLDTLGVGYPPFGEVVAGMDVVDSVYAEYPRTPSQDSIRIQGNAYLHREFPRLDMIRTARIIQEWRGPRG